MKLASVELKKGAWSPEEDQKLIAYVNKCLPKNWCQLPKAAGLARSGKSCRLRWLNYLKPDLKRGRLTADEIETIIKLHKSLGNKWTQIAAQLPGRTDNEIKNFWHLNNKKCSKSMQGGNGNKSNKPKRGNRKVNEEEDLWLSSYGLDELNLLQPNSRRSSMITESIDFPIAESYSSITADTIVSPQELSQAEDSYGVPFCIEDVCIPEFISSMLEMDTFEDVQESTPISGPDESTFWSNILKDAERLGAN